MIFKYIIYNLRGKVAQAVKGVTIRLDKFEEKIADILVSNLAVTQFKDNDNVMSTKKRQSIQKCRQKFIQINFKSFSYYCNSSNKKQNINFMPPFQLQIQKLQKRVEQGQRQAAKYLGMHMNPDKHSQNLQDNFVQEVFSNEKANNL